MTWDRKANLKGPVGPDGPRGPQGLPGVNATPSDEAVGGWLGTEGTSASKTALQGAVAAILAGKNAKTHFGAKGDEIADDTAALHASIDDAAQRVLSSGMKDSGLVYWPAGTYRVTDTLTIPPYVKIIVLGAVIIAFYGAGKPAVHITYRATDPSNLYAGFEKQQWMTGSIIDGSWGGFHIVNRSGAVGTTDGLEIGPRTDMNKQFARYTLRDITIQGFRKGLQVNSFHNYIAWMYNLRVERNEIGAQLGTDAGGNTNSGENLNFVDCLFGTSSGGPGVGILCNSHALDLTVRGGSIDFVTTGILIKKGYQRILVDGGHMEGINEGARRTATGGMVVSEVADNFVPDVIIRSNLPYVSKERGPQFRGKMNLVLELGYRNTGGFTAMAASDLWLCDDLVTVRDARIRYTSGSVLISKSLGGLPDPVLVNETPGTALAAMAGYQPNSVSNVTGVVVAGSPRGDAVGNSIEFRINGNGYGRFNPKPYVPVSAGETWFVAPAYKFGATGNAPTVSVRGLFYDSERILLPGTVTTQLARQTTIRDAWALSDGPARFTAPPGAAYFRPDFQISSSAGDGTPHLLSEFHTFQG